MYYRKRKGIGIYERDNINVVNIKSEKERYLKPK